MTRPTGHVGVKYLLEYMPYHQKWLLPLSPLLLFLLAFFPEGIFLQTLRKI